MRGLGRRLWRISAATFAVTVILLALALGLFRLALTQVPERRGQIEDWAAGAIGLPVELGGVDARLGFRGPELSFTDARILDARDETVLIEAAEGAITLDVLALVTGRIEPGRVVLSGVNLGVVREEDGGWKVLGPAGPALGGGGSLPRLDALPVSEVRLADLTIRFEDRQKGLGPWRFSLPYVDMVREQAGASVEASVGLPAVLGRGVGLQARISGQDEAGLPLGWSGRLDVDGLDLAAAPSFFSGAPWVPAGGSLDARLQFAGSRSRLERLTGRVSASDLALQAGTSGAPYQRMAARLDWSGGAIGWQLRVSDLEVARESRRWGSPTARVEVSGSGADRVVYADADFLRLEDVVPAAAFLPEAQAGRIGALAPRGGLRGLVVRAGPGTEQTGEAGISFSGELERVGFDPVDRLPGLSNVSGRFEGTGEAGRLDVGSRQFAFRAPWLFRDPLELDHLDVAVTWSSEETGFQVEGSELSAANSDLELEGQVRLVIPDQEGEPLDMEIDARALDVDVSSASKYLPVGIMPPGVVGWLDRAIVSGRVPEAVLRIEGPSRGFPYRGDEGLFRVSFPIQDLSLDFAEGWPRAEAVEADILFENEAFFADVSTGRLMDLGAGPVAVQIPDLAKGRLGIEGRASGSVAAAREWALATDLLRRILSPGLAPASVKSGSLEAEVDLLLPLTDLASNDVRVDLDLSDVDVAFDFLGAPVQDLGGRVRIHGAEVTGEELEATLADRPVVMGLGPDESGTTRLSLSGQSSVDAVDTLFGMEFAGQARGEAAWNGYLEFPGPGRSAPFNLSFRSDLKGVGIDLPAPLGKAPEDTRAVSLAVDFPEEGAQDWRVVLDEALVAAFRLEPGPEGLGLGRVADSPEGAPATGRPGVVFSGRVGTVDLADWARLASGEEGSGGGLGAGVVAGGRLTIGLLEAPTGTYRDVGVELGHAGEAWRLGVDSENIRGSVTIPLTLSGPARIEAEMDRLDLFPPSPDDSQAPDPAGAQTVSAQDTESPVWHVSPRVVPAMFITVSDFRIGNIRLGAALLDIEATPDGLELTRFDGGGETFTFQASGRAWETAEGNASELHLELSSSDIEATLASVGYTPAMTGDSGQFTLDVSWPGGLRSDVVSVMEGTASLEFRQGRLTAVDTGAGRIFGLLSLQALPRRLTLDFSDVFSGGLVYDEITGTFQIVGGDAYTTNLVLRGPTVDMGVVGRIGLAARDYNQTAVISADLSAAVPVAGVLAGGPIVGAALWVLSEALKNPLRTQVTYSITGPWEDPSVERVAWGSRAPDGKAPGSAAGPEEAAGGGASSEAPAAGGEAEGDEAAGGEAPEGGDP